MNNERGESIKAWKFAAGMASLGIVTYVALPRLLRRLGLHSHYQGRRFNLPGKRALVITTSHDTLGGSGKATDPGGEPLLKGRRVTGVIDKQVQELGISITPQHPETELRQAGAFYEHQTAVLDVLANLTVVDGRLVTGQNL